MREKNYRVMKGLVVNKVGGKTTIFDGETSTLLTLNETASYIFGKIKAGKNKNEIVASMAACYGVDRKRALIDYQELVEDLLKKKIIVVAVK